MQPIIALNDLSKSFQGKKAVDELSFTVNQGEVFAFLGANGSGKTTSIRCLLNIYQTDKGEALVNGQPYSSNMVSILGYLPEERGLYLSSRVLETLVFFGMAKGMSESQAHNNATEYLKRVELLPKANVEIKKLSSGQQQKVQLGVALINQPQLLILDEPTKGLDPLNRDLLMDMLMEFNQNGATIVFITHQMEEVEKIADRLVMIKEGRRILYGEVDQVKAEFGTNTIHLRYRGEIPDNPALYQFETERNTAEITPVADTSPNDIMRYLLESGVEVRKFEVSSPSLHEVFIQVSNERSDASDE